MDNSVKSFGDTIAWYNANAKKYAANIENYPSINYLNEFSQKVGIGGTVLDAGCAAGRDTHLLKINGLNAIGLDLSKSLLDIARHRHSDLEFIEGNFFNLPFPDQSFDGVWSHASLVHLETTEDVMKALK